MPEVILDSIFYAAQGKMILNNISMHARPGKIYQICGKNGAGKSTLLKIIGGLITPESGKVQIKKSEKEQLTSSYVSQTLIPYEDFYVKDFLNFQSRSVLRKINPKTCAHWIEKLEVRPLLQQTIQNLSAGQWKRVQLARALTAEPKLLLLDEVDAHLDATMLRKVSSIVQNLATQENVIIFVVSHDINFLRHPKMEYLAMQSGHLMWKGTHDDFFKHKINLKIFSHSLKDADFIQNGNPTP